MKGRATRWHAGLALAVLPVMGGCASFGSNIAGSFSCPAPDGICAPSSSIDDRALALITAEAPDAVPSPEGPYRDPDMGAGKAPRTAVASPRRMPVSIGEAGRTREKVLRIVFQPYIDERGRLHETSAVHAVVAQGEWQQQAIADASGLSSRNERAAAYAGETLADAVDRAETERLSPAEGLPDPAAVAAARARATADPVASIKSDVAAVRYVAIICELQVTQPIRTGTMVDLPARIDRARERGQCRVGAFKFGHDGVLLRASRLSAIRRTATQA